MIPVDIGSCLGWIHPGASARGVVLCGALDYEGLCTYRAWHDLAEGIAAAGCPVLRFDYPGRGDSLDPRAGADLFESCVAAARAAIERLRAEAGVEEVVLAGLRFGALVAAQAAAGRDDVEALVLLAPAASGRAFARELTIQARLLASSLPAAAVGDPAPGVAVAGFVLSEADLAGIKRVDLAKVAGLAPRHILLAEPQDRADKALAAHLATLGGTVEQETFAGYEDLMRSPTMARAPAAWARVTGWIAAGRPERPARPVEPGPVAFQGPDWRETVVRFGPDRGLPGIVCRPSEPRPSAPFVVLANSGRNPRSGWARSATVLARRLAGEGFASLRFDGTGIGDGRPAPAGAEPLYSREAQADLRAALDAMEQAGERDFLLLGACSGAYAVFHAAVEDRRVGAAACVNLQRFIWRHGDSLEVVMRQAVKPAEFYRRNLFRRETLSRLLRGDIDVGSIAAGLFRRKIGKPVGRILGAVAGRIGIPTPTARVRAWMQGLEKRGARLLLVHSAGDPGLDEMLHHFGPGEAWLSRRRNVGRVLIADSDHDLTPARAREDLWQALISFLGGARPVAAEAPAVRADGN